LTNLLEVLFVLPDFLPTDGFLVLVLAIDSSFVSGARPITRIRNSQRSLYPLLMRWTARPTFLHRTFRMTCGLDVSYLC